MVTHAFTSAKSDGSDPTEVQPSHWNEPHVGYDEEWPTVVELQSDQTVTASTTLVDSSELQVAVTAGSVWRFELSLLYSGTSLTGDFRWAFTVSAGTMTGWHRWIGEATTADAINVSTGVRVSAAVTTTPGTAGTDAISTPRSLLIEATYRFTSAGTFKLQFAQNSASGASKIVAGSILKAKRII